MLTSTAIRELFLAYFEKHLHTNVASSSLIPQNDPSLLFVNSGMVQFKKIFLGQERREYTRACSVQKCLRVGGKHNDLENIGKTARHHTFFEMLGNFSFGDYFKEDAIRFAWNFIKDELKLPLEKLYITVYKDDDEALKLWEEISGFSSDRIFKLGEKDNFWSMGDTGPCGPSSEIFIDQGEDMSCGENCGIGSCDCDRYLEIWNLVFMQYNQDEDGVRTKLPHPSIDTGMGLERISAVCQNVRSNFESDIFQTLIQFIAKKANVTYNTSKNIDVALQVIADHSRSIAFLIADQVMPSNEGRGYILRRLIRRAFRFGRVIGLEKPFLFEIVQEVIRDMGGFYTELAENKDFLARVVLGEEERFSKTLGKGLELLSEEIKQLEKKNETVLTGEVSFKLYDTYGFPFDIVTDVLEGHNMTADEEQFKALMLEQKERAKKAWKGSGEKDLASFFQVPLEQDMQSVFTGYETLTDASKIIYLLNESGKPVETLACGEEGFLLTEKTPFYGESGGQCGDIGHIRSKIGHAQVLESLKASTNLTVHKISVDRGSFALDEQIELFVNENDRLAIARNHTSTHLLHAALRTVLGEHVKQSGSLVGSDRLRFDFTHDAQMTKEEIEQVEQWVNTIILANIPVICESLPYAEALEKGAMALFGEKYLQEVRMLSIENASCELCSGTHLKATGQAGSFLILSETGIAAGIRRIEASTGLNALRNSLLWKAEKEEIVRLTKAKNADIVGRVQLLLAQIKDQSKEIEQLEQKIASNAGASLLSQQEEIAGIKVLCASLPQTNQKNLRDQMDALRSKIDEGIICLAASLEDDKVGLLVFVHKDLHSRFTAQGFIKELAGEIKGTGGGRADVAQAGGTYKEGIPSVFEKLKNIITTNTDS